MCVYVYIYIYMYMYVYLCLRSIVHDLFYRISGTVFDFFYVSSTYLLPWMIRRASCIALGAARGADAPHVAQDDFPV